MIGRQFHYYCCTEDLAEIEEMVFRPLGGRVMEIVKANRAERIVEGSAFSLPLDRMGKESLFLIIAPPSDIADIRWDGPWVDRSSSHLIQIGRSYIKDGVIKSGRFWYSPVDRTRVKKPTEYLKWAEAVCRKTKTMLARHPIVEHPSYIEWFGKVARERIVSGALRASLD